VSNIYSSLEGDDYRAAFSQLERELSELAAFCDEKQIRRLSAAPRAEPSLAPALVEAIERVNAAALLAETLDSFIHAFVSTNSYDALAAREASKLELVETRRRQLHVRLQGWIGSLAPLLTELIAGNEVLAEHAFFLQDAAKQSRYLMSEELEALAAELSLDAGGAFGKLQGNVTSQLKVAFERDGHSENLPITVIRNLSFHPDPEVRRRAYEAEQQGWTSIRTTVAACLNGVKGTALTLSRRRGRASVLDAALDQNRIDRPTLDALLGAIREAFPMFVAPLPRSPRPPAFFVKR
jgi:oligoendopeptidase F